MNSIENNIKELLNKHENIIENFRNLYKNKNNNNINNKNNNEEDILIKKNYSNNNDYLKKIDNILNKLK